MTWYAATDRCKAKGGKLVEIDSEEENTALIQEIKKRANHTTDSDGKKIHFWIGLSDVKHEGNWSLASNGLNPSYLNWTTGEPSNDKDKDCARLKTGRLLGTWADTDCSSESLKDGKVSLHALCEYDSLTTSSSTEDTTTKGQLTKW